MDKRKIAAAAGAAGMGVALLIRWYLKRDREKWEQAQDEIDLLESMGLPPEGDGAQSREELDLLESMGQSAVLRGKPLILSTAKERQFQFQRLETGTAGCCLCGRPRRRCEMAPARYAFAPLGPQADRQSLAGLLHLPVENGEEDWESRERRERTRCRMLSGLPLEWEAREKAKLLSFREGAADLPALVRGQFLRGFGLDDGSPICRDCAKKLQAAVAERQGWTQGEDEKAGGGPKSPCKGENGVV